MSKVTSLKLSDFKGGSEALPEAVGGTGVRPPVLQTKVTPELKQRVKELADEFDVSMSELIRWLIYRFEQEVADAKRSQT